MTNSCGQAINLISQAEFGFYFWFYFTDRQN